MDPPFPIYPVLFALTRGARLIAVAVLFLLAPSPARAETVDHIVATVNNEVITASELALAVALNTRFGGADADRETLAAETLNGLVTRRLLVQEARRLRFVEVSDQELTAETEKLAKRFGSDKAFFDFLKEHDLTPAEVTRMLGERLLVARFVEKKVGLFVRVSRDEARAFFDSHASDYHGRRFQDVQKTIVALLTERKIGQQLDQYISELRAKADIRINPGQENERQARPDSKPLSAGTKQPAVNTKKTEGK
jgi:hypothetical protein